MAIMPSGYETSYNLLDVFSLPAILLVVLEEDPLIEPDLDMETTMAVLGPHLPALHGCILRGFARYQEEYPSVVRAEHDNRAAAACVYAHIATEVTATFEEVPQATMLDVRGLRVLNINDQVVIRFKKVDETGRSVSYPTMQARSFDRQLPLPNVPVAAVRLTVGYEPDLAFSEIVRVVVACPLGKGIYWCTQINSEENGSATWVDITPQRFPGTERFRRYGTGDA